MCGEDPDPENLSMYYRQPDDGSVEGHTINRATMSSTTRETITTYITSKAPPTSRPTVHPRVGTLKVTVREATDTINTSHTSHYRLSTM